MKINKLLLICTILALSLTTVGQVKADDFLELEIDGGVIVPWDIGNVMPGASGVIDVSIHNAGNINGYIAVWIDVVVDTEGNNTEAETGNTDEPGELSQYLTLNISGDHISPYTASPGFTQPVTLHEFPGDSVAPLQLSDQPLVPDETIQVQWEWAIPPATTNIIQGDQVSFNINYILTQYLIVTRQHTVGPVGGAVPIDTDDSDTEDDDIDESTEDITEPDIEEEEQDTKDTGVTDIIDDSKSSGAPTFVPFVEAPGSTDALEDIAPSVKDDDLKPALPGSEDSKSKTYVLNWFSSLSSPMREILYQTSLIVAISGTLAMIVLAYIERKRRNSRHASVQTPNVE